METKPKRNSGHYGRDPEISARNQDRIRALIKVEEIIKKLNNHILGKAKMTNTMVRAAEILLRKIQPDLTAIQLSQDEGQGVPLLKIVRQATLEHEAIDALEAELESEVTGADRQIEHALVPSSEVMPD